MVTYFEQEAIRAREEHAMDTSPTALDLTGEFDKTVRDGSTVLFIRPRNDLITSNVAANGSRVICVDTEEKLRYAPKEREAIGNGSREYIVVPDLRTPALEEGTVDNAILLGTLGGFAGKGERKRRREILRGALHVLKPGGAIYVAEFAPVDGREQDYDGRTWADIYQEGRAQLGEINSFRRDTSAGFVTSVTHHFTPEEITNDLSIVGAKEFVPRENRIRETRSGHSSPVVSVWARKL